MDATPKETAVLYTQKTGVPVYVPLPPFVVEALEACPRLSERYWFWTGVGLKETLAGNWRRTFRRLCEIAGVQGGPPAPPCFFFCGRPARCRFELPRHYPREPTLRKLATIIARRSARSRGLTHRLIGAPATAGHDAAEDRRAAHCAPLAAGAVHCRRAWPRSRRTQRACRALKRG